MGEWNSKYNRVVWVDIPVLDLDRAAAFYRTVLAIGVTKETMGAYSFCVFDHEGGNGACLMLGKPNDADDGIMLYFNADGRLREAVPKVEEAGGSVVIPIHAIGQHGFRAVLRDTEGNRLALHSMSDA